MFVPYVTAVPQFFPFAPNGIGPGGLSHTGYNPLAGTPGYGWINPLQLQGGYPYGYGYGYRPMGPVGYVPTYNQGLSHTGYGYDANYNPMAPWGYAHPTQYGYAPMGYGPMQGYGTPMHQQMQAPLQPNWSSINGGPQTTQG
ncbi:hypothetical protein [Vulgatibacter sp.]|uniref:hypothetical protein n=1 Tax=Vulgatibacter sp. TaxID=1971226 RepID=UPI0035616506